VPGRDQQQNTPEPMLNKQFQQIFLIFALVIFILFAILGADGVFYLFQ